MDKKQYMDQSVKQKSGFALMITLSVLAVIIALTVALLGYFESVQKEARSTKALIQADIYYADIVEAFGQIKEKKTLFSVLYSAVFPIQGEGVSMMLKCDPLAKGVNINWLGIPATDKKKGALYSVAQELFDFIVEEYTIEDAQRLLEMLHQEIDPNQDSSRELQRRLTVQKGIHSYDQFEALLERYQFEVDDRHIGEVPWSRYFSFTPGAQKIDAEYSSPELIAFLFDINPASVKEWGAEFPRRPLEVFVAENGANYAQRKGLFAGEEFLEAAECSVLFTFEDYNYAFRFEYYEGETKYFEFFGQQ